MLYFCESIECNQYKSQQRLTDT